MRRLTRLLPYLCGVLLFAAPPTTENAGIDPNRYLEHIKYLASAEMRGRATGSPELEKAADYIAGQFRAIGLQPIEGKSYFQAFEVTTSARMGRGNHFEFVEDGKTTPLKAGEDFI